MRNSLGRWSFTLWSLVAASCAPASIGYDATDAAADGRGLPAPPDAGLPAGSSAITVHLVDGPLDNLAEVKVDLQRVAILSDSGQEIELSQPGAIVDLLKLQGGVSATIASQALPAGHYSQLRLALGSRNSLTLADGSNVPLQIPSGMQSGLKLQLDLSTKVDSVQDVFIDFDVAESLHVQMNRHLSRYMLRPVLRTVVKQRTGTLFGTLVNAADGQPLAGVELLAQQRGPDGEPVVVRRVRSTIEGRYQLDLLPFGEYRVLARPVVEGTPYELSVSEPLVLTEQTPQASFDVQSVPAIQQGSLTIRIMSGAGDSQSDICMLYRGPAEAPMIVATAVPQQIDAIESAVFGPLPSGDYFAKCLRRSEGTEGTVNVVSSLVSSLTVASESLEVPIWL